MTTAMLFLFVRSKIIFAKQKHLQYDDSEGTESQTDRVLISSDSLLRIDLVNWLKQVQAILSSNGFLGHIGEDELFCGICADRD